jgi:hypothetical protein
MFNTARGGRGNPVTDPLKGPLSEFGLGNIEVVDVGGSTHQNLSHTEQYARILKHMHSLHEQKLHGSCVAILVLEDDAAAARGYRYELSRSLTGLSKTDPDWLWVKLWLGVSSFLFLVSWCPYLIVAMVTVLCQDLSPYGWNQHPTGWWRVKPFDETLVGARAHA